MLKYSPLESERFGLRIGRATFNNAAVDLPAFREELSTSSYDFIVVRVPAGLHDVVQDLRVQGLEPVHADTLVYYERDLGNDFSNVNHDEPTQVRYGLAEPDDIDAVSAIAAASFSDYRSHYHAAPEFGHSDILAGYIEWAAGFLIRPTPESSTYVARAPSGEVVGFYGCITGEEDGVRSIEIVLNAILPGHQGAGVYRGGLSSIMRDASDRGVDRLLISTQVWNYRVQKAWAACGLRLFRAYDTYHVRPMIRR
ncbi:GNAT family N-acetyltransferase [Luteimonas fraxinea]|uniref:GNAT family N-acetyltransferase n=1 Tax=Luteimonas fraxinea TaxID=2901869 RepID=A0ABS8UH24_9GAMM|nr:GNAT family N-acetyltransferase [Luteimonas fraxinea]MCD9098589.1 GNAT family N-acetyltransferase [Luteimonas fraxinea]MCD9127322.1 GNAT family N-acetyltransferase [Luteimonas fraxinea]UHH09008.1 GNAT family N-acetyltransferase [Luteimonas fraxinea]